MSKTSKQIGKYFRVVRLHMKLTTRTVAKETGINYATLSRSERGENEFTCRQMIVLARYYGIDMEVLIDTCVVFDAEGRVI